MAKLYENLPEVAGTIGDLAGGAGAMLMALRGRQANKEVPTLAASAEAASLARTLAAASTDPNHPWFRNLAALLEEQARRDATNRTLADIMLRRRARARGGMGGAITSDRRDEERSRNLALMFMQARENARLAARQYLSDASGNAANAAKAYAYSFAPYQNAAEGSRGELYTAMGGLGDLASNIGKLGEIFAGRQPVTVRDVPQQLTAPGELRPVPVETVPLGYPSYYKG